VRIKIKDQLRKMIIKLLVLITIISQIEEVRGDQIYKLPSIYGPFYKEEINQKRENKEETNKKIKEEIELNLKNPEKYKEEDRLKAEGYEEIKEEREEYTKVYRTQEGKEKRIIYFSPIHEEKEGKWEEIELEFKEENNKTRGIKNQRSKTEYRTVEVKETQVILIDNQSQKEIIKTKLINEETEVEEGKITSQKEEIIPTSQGYILKREIETNISQIEIEVEEGYEIVKDEINNIIIKEKDEIKGIIKINEYNQEEITGIEIIKTDERNYQIEIKVTNAPYTIDVETKLINTYNTKIQLHGVYSGTGFNQNDYSHTDSAIIGNASYNQGHIFGCGSGYEPSRPSCTSNINYGILYFYNGESLEPIIGETREVEKAILSLTSYTNYRAVDNNNKDVIIGTYMLDPEIPFNPIDGKISWNNFQNYLNNSMTPMKYGISQNHNEAGEVKREYDITGILQSWENSGLHHGILIRAENTPSYAHYFVNHNSRLGEYQPRIEITTKKSEPIPENYPINETKIYLRPFVQNKRNEGILYFGALGFDGIVRPNSIVSARVIEKESENVVIYENNIEAIDGYRRYPQYTINNYNLIERAQVYYRLTSNYQMPSLLYNQGQIEYDKVYQSQVKAINQEGNSEWIKGDNFQIHQVSSYDRIDRIISYYGIENLEQFMQDNNMMDGVLIQNNVIFIRNPTKNAGKRYISEPLSEADKRAIDNDLLGRNVHCVYGYEPINFNTGNFLYTNTDYAYSEYEEVYPFERNYNSMSVYRDSMFGYGWSVNVIPQLFFLSDGRIEYEDGTGRIITFKPNINGGYETPYGTRVEIEKEKVGTGSRIIDSGYYDQEDFPIQTIETWDKYEYEIKEEGGKRLRFNEAGQIIEVKESQKNYKTSYEYENYRLIRMKTIGGKEYNLSYNEAGYVSSIKAPDGSEVNYEYDEEGNLKTLIDQAGYRLEYQYDDNHLMISYKSRETEELIIENSYDEKGRVIKQVNALKEEVYFEYEENKTIVVGESKTETVETDNYGYTKKHDERETEYDLEGRIKKTKTKEGIEKEYKYNELGQVIEEKTAGKIRSYNYDEKGNIKRIIDENNEETNFEYNDQNQITKTIYPNGEISERKYNELSQIIYEKDEVGIETWYSYDNTMMASQTDALGNKIQFKHDQIGRRISYEDQIGNITNYKYDERGLLIEIQTPEYSTSRSYNGDGELVIESDGNGNKRVYEYDKWSRLIKESHAYGSKEYSYDEKGNINKIIDELGNETTQEYNENNQLIASINAVQEKTEYKYNELGQIIETIYPDGGVSEKRYNEEGLLLEEIIIGEKTSYQYDNKKRVIEKEFPDGRIETYQYDEYGQVVLIKSNYGDTIINSYAGRLLISQEINGRETSYEYDEIGQLIKETDPMGYSIETSYLPNGLIKEQSLSNGSKIIYHYDRNGRIIGETNGIGAKKEYKLDGNGNQIEIKDENGNISRIEYNALNQPIKIETPTGIIKLITYNNKGQVISEIIQDDYGRSEIKYTYTALGQIEKIEDSLGREKSYKYNSNGQILEENIYGRKTSYQYNEKNQLIEEISSTMKIIYSYDENNRVKRIINSLGEEINNEYNEKGELIKKTNELGQSESYEYNEMGLITKNIDLRGNESSYEYDLKGNIIEETDIYGVTTKTIYNGIGQEETTKRLGVISNKEYDEAGRLVKEEIEGLGISELKYDLKGNITEEIDGLGNRTQYKYDQDDRLIKIIDPKGGVIETEYDRHGNPLKIKDSNGGIVQFKYDSEGREIEKVDELGFKSEKKYDDFDNIIEEIDGLGNSTKYEYNEANQITKIIKSDGSKSIIEYNEKYQKIKEKSYNGNISTYSYNEKNQLEIVSAPNGLKTSYEYNKFNELETIYNENNNQVIEGYGYDKYGRIIKVIDNLGNKTITKYNHQNQVIGLIEANGLESQIIYDQYGRIIEEKNYRGLSEQFEYNSINQVVKTINERGIEITYEYDSNGNLISLKEGELKEEFVYDEKNQLIVSVDKLGNRKEIIYDLKGQIIEEIDERGDSRKYRYDGVGNTVEEIDGVGNKTQYEYDKVYNQVAIKDSNNQVIRYEYDKEGNILKIKYLGNNTREFVYDNMNQLLEVKDIDKSLEKYSYDLDGNIVEYNNQGKVIKNEYNEKNQLISISSKDETINYKYNQWGLLIESKNEVGSTLIEYNIYNEIEKVVDTKGNIIEYKYDLDGNQIEIIYPSGKVVRSEYNEKDQLTKVNVDENETIYNYDEYFRLSNQLSNGVETSYEYDELGLVKKQKSIKDGKLISDISIIRDSNDNIIEEVGNIDGEYFSKEFKYDNKDQLIKSSIEVIKENGEKSLEVIINEYDKLGNRIYSKINRAGIVIEEEYKYNQDYQLIKIKRSDGNDTVYSYDKQGNVINKTVNGVKESYSYNEQNQLVEIKDGKKVIEYQYDGLGNRVSKEVRTPYKYLVEVSVKADEIKETGDDLTNQLLRLRNQYELIENKPYCSVEELRDGIKVEVEVFVNDINLSNVEVLSSKRSDGEEREYIYGYNRIMENSSEEGEKIYVSNIYNDVVLEIREKDGEIERIGYNIYGKPLEEKKEGYGYRGEYHEGDLQYLRARYYDVESGRFISKDSYLGEKEDSVSHNRYTYVLNNPIKYYDKDGHKAKGVGIGSIPSLLERATEVGTKANPVSNMGIASVKGTVVQKAEEKRVKESK
jgi:RHS repeat-associated core domain